MHQHITNWFHNVADIPSLRWFGGTLAFATVSHITANQVTLFFTVVVGTTATILNVIKTKATLDKEKRRKQGHETQEDLEDDD